MFWLSCFCLYFVTSYFHIYNVYPIKCIALQYNDNTVQFVSLAVYVLLSILAISVVQPFLKQLVLIAYVQMSISNAHIDKLEVKLSV